jgi:hypothetical protein
MTERKSQGSGDEEKYFKHQGKKEIKTESKIFI